MSDTAEVGRFGDVQEKLLDTIQQYQESTEKGTAESPLELILAMRSAATVKLQTSAKQLPSWIDREEITSFMDEMILKMIETMDLSMDPKQIMKWIYLRFGSAIKDAQRELDLLTRRQRELANLAQKQVVVRERKLGRELTDTERREEARKVLGPIQSKRHDVERFLTLITGGIQQHGLDDAQVMADDTDPATDAVDAERKQALHIAGIDIEDDELFQAFSELANDAKAPPAPLKKRLEAHLQQQLLSWRTPDEASLELLPAPDPAVAAAQQIFVFDDNRPLRYLHFIVENWGLQHESRIEAVAEPRLGMRIVIDRRSKRADVYAAEPPLEMWGIRRWRLFAAILRAPNLRDSDWPIYAAKIKDTLPYGLRLRVITEEIFDRQVKMLASTLALNKTIDVLSEKRTPQKSQPKARVERAKCVVVSAEASKLWGQCAITDSTMTVSETTISLVKPARPHLKWDWRIDQNVSKEALIVSKDKKSGRYVVTAGVKGSPLLVIEDDVTNRLDSEFEDGSTWVLRAWIQFPRSGALKLSLTSLRLIKHGAGCRKRGCLCEVGKEAERERQQLSRERRRLNAGLPPVTKRTTK